MDDVLIVVRLRCQGSRKIAACVRRGNFKVGLRVATLTYLVGPEVTQEPRVRLTKDVTGEFDAIDGASVDFAEDELALAIGRASVDVGKLVAAIVDEARLESTLPGDAAFRLLRVVVAEGRAYEQARFTIDVEEATDPEGRALPHQEGRTQVATLAIFATGIQVKVVGDVAVADVQRREPQADTERGQQRHPQEHRDGDRTPVGGAPVPGEQADQHDQIHQHGGVDARPGF